MTTPAPTEAAVLVVEDDENLRLTLADNLEDEGYAVDHFSTASAALEAARERSYDVVILDIMLPDVDGYAVCRELRKAGCRAGILMLTARTLEDDLVAGFDAGADDYLAKPYRLRELLARVGALVRRRSDAVPSASEETLAGIRIDRRARTVVGRDGSPVELTRTEFDLLVFLLDHASEALSRERILEEVWGTDVVVDPRTVDNFISSIKRKLRWEPGCGFAVRAVRGVGYRLEFDA
jgi:two-component system, OmpR family, phosphate regulon response regulator PhoB